MESPVVALDELRTAVVEQIGALLGDALLHGASDDELTASVALAGDLLRIVEGILVEGVAELARRSRSLDRSERLTTREGCHDLNELVQRLTRCSSSTAARFERAQRAVAAERDPLTDEERPARLPAMREALLAGDAGLDAVLAVSQPLLAMRDRVARERVLLADEVLAAATRGEGPDAAPPTSADTLRLHAQAWATVLDEDGAEPTEADRAFRRGVTLGRARHGVVPLRGDLLPEVAAQLQRIFDSCSPQTVAFAEDHPDDGTAGGVPRHDDRTRAQKQHDALMTALTAAAASRDLPTIGGAAPTLVVSVRESDLVEGRGWAHADGVDEPLTVFAAQHVACAGVVQRVLLGENGRILRLGTEERVFNRYQRRSIALRDGGCVIPGCSVPAAWCEIHHVTDHAKGGPTHTDNGVLVCWHHHRFIDSGPWRIRMNRGVPEILASPWLDPAQRWRPVTKSRTRMLDLVGRRT